MAGGKRTGNPFLSAEKKAHKNVLAEKKLAAIMRATSSETLAGFAASKKIFEAKSSEKKELAKVGEVAIMRATSNGAGRGFGRF
ncbi:hypothetical protein OQJ46_14065 [Microbulbifer thermotolerans]|uniref:hypothetical protein n=1 Tax=Microbulbifer thermotolerans TaxID=252514 RepID=UPI00224B7A75|nr:hypothetical protein [Microbulbifer thermotolerans]MCX2784114.1 hypothetical protein [Microbulbifer thermotolerans]